MLLVTRGIETTTDDSVFDGFVHYFIGANLVSERYRPLIAAAKARDYNALTARKEDALALCDDMQKLYESMDDSLRFNLPQAQSAQEAMAAPPEPASPAHAPANGKPDAFKDFRGVGCPLNFVKTKLLLEPMERGKKLEVWLDDGEPVENVPRSVQAEGHKVLHVRKIGSHWSVLIEKA
jgi:sulfite reductase (ferredoxin)